MLFVFFKLVELMIVWPNYSWFYQLYLRLSVVYKSITVHLGQSQELIMSIEIYLKCKYTYENAGFCILCIDDFKILKFFIKLSKFPTIFHRETSQAPTPPPHSPTSIWRFSWTKSICDASLSEGTSIHCKFYTIFSKVPCLSFCHILSPYQDSHMQIICGH